MCAFHLRINSRCQNLCSTTYGINSLHMSTYVYAHTIHILYTLYIHTHSHIYKSIDSPAPCGDMVVARERSRQRGEEGWRWRSEFTAFNIGKMKYDRGRRASKESPFCGIDKFILLPWFVGGWCNFDHRVPMRSRVSIMVFSNVSLF